MSTPTGGLSVIVPTRDRADYLTACLAALRAALREGDELVVVDSASSDPRVAEVARAHGAVVIRCDRPGASRARNVGWRQSAHDVVAFVDDDVRVASGWATAMCAAFTDEETAFVTGRVGIPRDQVGLQRPVAIKDDPAPHRLDLTTPAPLGASANLGVRRSVLELVGGFDEILGGGARFQSAEDVDLFDRLLGAGLTGVYEPAAAAEHDQWRSRRMLLRLDLRYGFGGGARLAKLLRTDRSRARQAAREAFWADGLRPLWAGLHHRHEFEVATAALRLLGTAVGVAWGLSTRVRDGRFAPRLGGRHNRTS